MEPDAHQHFTSNWSVPMHRHSLRAALCEAHILDGDPLEEHNTPSSVPSCQVLAARIKLNC